MIILKIWEGKRLNKYNNFYSYTGLFLFGIIPLYIQRSKY